MEPDASGDWRGVAPLTPLPLAPPPPPLVRRYGCAPCTPSAPPYILGALTGPFVPHPAAPARLAGRKEIVDIALAGRDAPAGIDEPVRLCAEAYVTGEVTAPEPMPSALEAVTASAGAESARTEPELRPPALRGSDGYAEWW
jgi:hypothetical protein